MPRKPALTKGLPKRLKTMEELGLIHLAQRKPELEYLFNHTLLQDAAYNSLLRADRIELHRRIGETLETLYAEHHAEIAPVLGRFLDGMPRRFEIASGDNRLSGAIVEFNAAGRAVKIERLSLQSGVVSQA